MEKFTKLSGIAAPLDLINVNTDVIIPKQFLKTLKKTGLGKNLFDEIRYNNDGSIKDDFVLNDEYYKNAEILITGANFGCGSSREHAPWAIIDFGIKAIISTSFADIFYNNCFNNGICPIVVDEKSHKELMNVANMKNNSEMTIDLVNLQIVAHNKIYKFKMDDMLKERLLLGLDHIDITLKDKNDIQNFEKNDKKKRPWLSINF